MTAEVVFIAFASMFVLVFTGLAFNAYTSGKMNALTWIAKRLCDSAEENLVRYAIILAIIVCGIFFCKSMLG